MTQMWQEIMESPVALERCLEVNHATLDEIVRGIKARQIDQVIIAARGTSDHAAVYGKYVIELLTGIPVSLAASSVFTIYKRSLKLDNALVIGISQSGEAADVLEVLQSANSHGALTVGITNFNDSPLAKEVQFHLCCEAGVEKSVAATKTFTTEMYLLAKLTALWASSEELDGELATLPQRITQCFTIAGELEDKVTRYRFIEDCFVLARGINYAVALEAALKIQETTYVRALAFASSDFQHGPIAMLDREIPAFIYAPNGPSLEDAAAIIHKLRDHDVEMMIVTNNPDIAALGAASLPIPQTSNDMISPFFNAIVAQMFACQLSLAKGLNPDSPRGLHKVTITK